MRADLRSRKRKCFKRLFAIILRRMVNNNKIRFTYIEISCANPIRRIQNIQRILQRVQANQLAILFSLILILTIGCFIRIF